MLPLLPDLDRSLCARPIVTAQGLAPCGLLATIRPSEGSGMSWAYCEAHAKQEAAFLEQAAEHVSAAALPTAWEWRHSQVKLDAIRCALEVC
jgi:hypothetical protein